MTYARWKHISENSDATLTESEWKLGWHFCDEFDGLLVGPDMGEMAHCHCEFTDHEVSLRIAEARLNAQALLAEANLSPDAL